MADTSVTWTLVCNGVSNTAAGWGISDLVRHRRSQTTDTVTFNAPGLAVDAAPLFAYGATVTVSRGGTPWFVGRVTRVPAQGDDKQESQTYELSGPWWYLEKLVCRQIWNTNLGTATTLSTRLILGQALNGQRMTTGQVILETLQYAVDCGAPLAIGTIDPTLLPPYDEVKDVTCADVLKQMLRWHPDCVTWFDYSTSPNPTLHVRLRANLAAGVLTVGSAPLSRIQGITRRDDLQPPSVVIHYEVTGSSNGQPTFQMDIDAAPAGATGREFGAVCCTIPLRGLTTSKTQQRVVTQGIHDSATDSGILAYLTAHYGDLALKAADPDITADGITITACSRGLADPNALELDPAGGTVTDPSTGLTTPKMRQVVYDSTLTNELIQGTITDWMFKSQNIRSQVHRLTFSYDCDSGSGDDDGDDDDDGSASNQTYQGTIDITATNAGSSGTPATTIYSTVTGYDPGDAVPIGLAAAYLAGFAVVQYSGSLLMTEPEAGGAATTSGLIGSFGGGTGGLESGGSTGAGSTGSASLGQVLNLLGSSQPAWETMNAMITDETVNVDSGTTTLTFGPPEHLSPQDLVNLLKVTRPGSGGGRTSGDSPGALSTPHSDARTSGAQGTSAAIGLGVSTPTNNACPQAGGGAGDLLWWNVAANGVPAFAQFSSTAPTTTLPADAIPVNPN